jgi:hypothetical protein
MRGLFETIFNAGRNGLAMENDETNAINEQREAMIGMIAQAVRTMDRRGFVRTLNQVRIDNFKRRHDCRIELMIATEFDNGRADSLESLHDHYSVIDQITAGIISLLQIGFRRKDWQQLFDWIAEGIPDECPPANMATLFEDPELKANVKALFAKIRGQATPDAEKFMLPEMQRIADLLKINDE